MATLNYVIEGSGPKVMLLHPVGLDLTFLAPVAHRLRDHFRVMCVDLRGHGRSPAEPPAQSLDDYADDLYALLKEKDFLPVAPVGFSFGGMVAQALAIRYPRAVNALVPCACRSTLTDEGRKIARRRAVDAENGGMAAILDAAMKRWFTPAFLASGKDGPARQRLLSDNVSGWAQAWKAISGIDTAARLNEINVPTLCIAGELDMSSGPAIVRAIAEGIHGARYAEIKGAPHMLFIERPDEVARLVGDFLRETLKV